MRLLTRWWVWAIVVGLALVILWGMYGGAVKTWWWGYYSEIRKTDDTLQKIREAEEKLKLKDGLIADKTKQIQKLRVEADQARVRAQTAEAKAQRWALESERLSSVVAQLEADRKRLAPVRSLQEAQVELRRYGYDLPIVTRR